MKAKNSQERAFEGFAQAYICPSCGAHETWRSHRRTFRDAVAALLLAAPYRCRFCLRRFYVFLPGFGV